MSTSGSVTFRANRDQIIRQALLKVKGIDPEGQGTITTTQYSDAALMLNAMLKTWQTSGLQLWERRYAVIFPQKNQGVYVLGTPASGGDHASLVDNNLLNFGGFVKAKTTVAALSGASSVTIDTLSSSGTVGIPAINVTVGFNFGVQLNNGSLQWTTVNALSGGNVVTLSTTLSDAVAAGNSVYCYQTKLVRPLRILTAFYRQSTGNHTPIRLISKEEYTRFGMPSSTGVPVQAVYDPQSNSGFLSLYPVPQEVTGQIYIEFQKPIEDMLASSDDVDFPQEWVEPIIWNLALRLIEYGTPAATVKLIIAMATQTLSQVTGWDQEVASIYIAPDYTYAGR